MPSYICEGRLTDKEGNPGTFERGCRLATPKCGPQGAKLKAFDQKGKPLLWDGESQKEVGFLLNQDIFRRFASVVNSLQELQSPDGHPTTILDGDKMTIAPTGDHFVYELVFIRKKSRMMTPKQIYPPIMGWSYLNELACLVAALRGMRVFCDTASYEWRFLDH